MSPRIPRRRPAGSNPTTPEQFWADVDTNGANGCWLWTGWINPDGYGIVGGNNRKIISAHRFAYELLVGPIPEGLTIDHVEANGCTSTACVKAIADEHGPAHLEPVTMGENVLRGNGPTAVNARKTHCLRGHPFDTANTRVRRDGRRCCRECNRLHGVAFRAKRQAS